MKAQCILIGISLSFFTTIGTVSAKDTTYMLKQYIKGNVNQVVLEKDAYVQIVKGDTNCIIYSNENLKHPNSICTIDRNVLYIQNTKSNMVKLILKNSMNLKLRDFAKVEINGNFIVSDQSIDLGDFAKLSVLDTLKANKLHLTVQEYATFNADNIKIDSLYLKVEDYATVQIKNGYLGYLNASQVEDFARLQISTSPCAYMSTLTKVEDVVIDKVKKRKYYKTWDFGFNFAWAYQNWSDEFFGLGETENIYNLKNGSFYALEFNYTYRFSKYFGIEFGLGYESDVLKLSNNVTYQLNRETNATELEINSDPNVMKYNCKLVARYVTIPISLRVQMGNYLYGSIGIVAGVNYNSNHTGLKCNYEYLDGTKADIKFSSFSAPNFSPYKLDIRFTYGFKYLQFFAQSSLLSIFKHGKESELYPFRVGLMIRL